MVSFHPVLAFCTAAVLLGGCATSFVSTSRPQPGSVPAPQGSPWPEIPPQLPPASQAPQALGISCVADVLQEIPELAITDVVAFRGGDVAHFVAPRRLSWIPRRVYTRFIAIPVFPDLVYREAAFVVFERLQEPDRGQFTDYFTNSEESTDAVLSEPEKLRVRVRRNITRRCKSSFRPADEVAWNLPSYVDPTPAAPNTPSVGDSNLVGAVYR